jgi:hypothetical protein
MTSLSMALVNMCGGDEGCVRTAALAKLRAHGPRPGAQVRINGKEVPLSKALADDKLANQIAVPDLLIALGVETYANDKLSNLGNWGTLAALADDLGIAHSAGKKGMGGDSLNTPEARRQAKQRLDQGEQIIVQTPNHICYLVDASDEGVVIHDPAGARLAPQGALFIDSGAPADLWSWRWLPRIKTEAEQETARRRLSRNPEALAVVELLIKASSGDGAEKEDAKKQLKAMKSPVEMGANNFYSATDIADYKLGVAVDLQAKGN